MNALFTSGSFTSLARHMIIPWAKIKEQISLVNIFPNSISLPVSMLKNKLDEDEKIYPTPPIKKEEME
jgi:hypothetical protein